MCINVFFLFFLEHLMSFVVNVPQWCLLNSYCQRHCAFRFKHFLGYFVKLTKSTQPLSRLFYLLLLPLLFSLITLVSCSFHLPLANSPLEKSPFQACLAFKQGLKGLIVILKCSIARFLNIGRRNVWETIEHQLMTTFGF